MLERELGRGGMASVYLARDLKHDRSVALKLLRPELGAVLGGDRFLREIKLTANLQHPNILPLLDSGEAAGQFFYVMPYVEGESLRQRLEREGQLPLDDALRFTSEVAEALDYAHQQGIIHRDIKPENILLSRGHALVADFGIALAVTQTGGGRLTETGLSLGTPAYMSPEQASASGKLDSRTDQYSLACVVYEMLAGEPPYTGPTAQAIIAKRFSEPIPHLSTVREVPVGMERAITRALARSPADRFSSVSMFAQALSADPTAPPGIAHSRPRTVRLKWLLSAAAVIPILAILALLGQHLRSTSERGVPTHRQFTFTAQAEEPSFSPDGKTIAYVSQHRSLVLEELAGGGPVTLVPPVPQLGSPRWSPDGRWLYFRMIVDATQPPAIYRIPSSGGAPVKVGADPLPADMVDDWGPFDLSPDGTAMVRVTGDSLVVFDLNSGKERARLPAGGPGLREGKERLTSLGAVRNVAWSPDGRWIASTEEGLGGSSILVTSADGQQGRRLAEGIGPVKWSPKGDALFFLAVVSGGTDLMRLPFDSHTGSASGQPRLVLSGLPTLLDWTAVYDLRRDGRMLAYVRGPQSHHVWALTMEPGRDTAIAHRLSEDSRAYDWPALKRDGTALAVIQYDGTGVGNFFVVPFGGGEFTPLTQGPGYKSNPSWSPDGTSLVYVLTDSTGSKLILTDQMGRRRRLGTTSPFLVGYYRTTWSADGRTLLYPAAHARTLVALDVAHGDEKLIPIPDSLDFWIAAVVSPDGRQVVAAENDRATNRYKLWRTPIGGSRWMPVPIPAGDNIPLLWREDGWIYLFNQIPGSLPVIWRIKPDGLRRELVAHLPVACRLGFVSMSGDGRRLVCAVHRLDPDVWLVSGLDPS